MPEAISGVQVCDPAAHQLSEMHVIAPSNMPIVKHLNKLFQSAAAVYLELSFSNQCSH